MTATSKPQVQNVLELLIASHVAFSDTVRSKRIATSTAAVVMASES